MDYWGNEVHGVDLAKAMWTMVKAASGLGRAAAPKEPMPDGNPVSRHTYDSLAYALHLLLVSMFGRTMSPNGFSTNNA